MTVEDKNFNIKNGLSVGTGKHQILDSNGRVTANYFTLNTGGRYLSAGVDLYDLISSQGIPPVSSNAWNATHNRVATSAPSWDGMYNWVNAESATINTEYNRNTFVNVSGDIITGNLGISGELDVVDNTYLEGSLRVDGHAYLSAAMYVENDAYVMGDFRADGNVWLAVEGVYPKVVYVGATNDDNIVFVADVSSNFIPNHDTTFDLGTSTQQWRELFVQDISASNDVFVDNDLLVSSNGTIGQDFRVSGATVVGGYTELSGTLDVKGFTTLHDDLSVKGDMYVDGNAYLSAGIDGNIYVGDVNTDNVIFNADVDSNIIPDDDVTYDLGTSTQQWRELFVQDVSATNDIFIDNDLLVSANGTVGHDFRVSGATVVGGYTELSGTLDVKDFTTLHDDLSVKGDMYVDGNVFLSAGESGEIYLGTDNTDNVIFRADVDSDIIPDDDVTYDLGTSTQQWRELFVQDVSATNDIFIDNDLLVSANGTIGQDFRVSGAVVVGGYTELSGTLDVKDFTTLHDDLSVKGDLYVDGNAYLSAGVDGNIYVGDVDTDNVIFRADVDSNIIPDDDVTFDLGTSTQQWRELFVQDVSASNDIFVDNDLLVSANGTVGEDFRVSGAVVVGGYTELSGTLDVKDFTTLHDDLSVKGDMYVDGNVFLSAGSSGEIYLGTDNTDNVIFNADVDSNIIPDDDVTFDLGTSTQQWRELFVQDISASNDIFVDNDLLVSANGTIGQDFRVSGATVVGGYTELSGTLDVKDFTTLHDDLSVKGDMYVDGNVFLSAGESGEIYLGTDSTDNVIFNADVDSNIIPDNNITFDLGTSTQQWRELFVQDVSASNDVFVDNDLLVSANGTVGEDFRVSGAVVVGGYTELSGTLDVKGFTTLHDDLSVKGDLYVDGNAYLSAGVDGNIYVGDVNTDNVIFNADVDSNIIPDDDVTYDLGTSTQQWRELFVQDISASNDVFVDNDLLVSANGTIGQDFRVSGHTTVSGNTTLSGTLDVDDATYVYDTLDVESKTTLHNDLLVSGDTHIVGDLRVDGNAYLSAGVDGIINVGDTNTDNVVFHADIDSGLTPNKNVTFDLGTSTQQWRELFVQDVSASNDVFVDNDLLVSANGTIGKDFRVSGHTTVSGNTVLSGALDVKDFTTLHDDLSVKGDLYVDGNAYLSAGVDGNIYVGDVNTDNVIFRADVDSNIIPDDDVTYDLGTSTQQWRELFVQDISATNDIFVDNDLLVSANGTIGQDFRVSGHTTVSGNTVLSGTLDVEDHTTLHNDLNVSGDGTFVGHLSGVSGMNIVGDTTLTGNLSVADNAHILSDATIEGDVRIKGSIVVDDHAYFGFGGQHGQINLGQGDVDEIVFEADVGSDILPYPSVTYNIGSLARRWKTIYTHDVDASGKITAQGHIISYNDIVQRKDINVDTSIVKKESIWRVDNTSNAINDISVATFDLNYQSAKYYIMAIAENGSATLNAEYIHDGSNVSGTIYGNAYVGTDPVKSVSSYISNGKLILSLRVDRYCKVMITGTGMYLR